MARLTISAFVLSALLQAAMSAPAVAAPGPASPISMKIDPSEIGVDLFYSGTAVHVEGVIPAGTEARSARSSSRGRARSWASCG